MLVCRKFNEVGSRDTYKGDFKELAVEGAKELEILCPVSKLTGFPMSMQQAIMYISDKNSRIAEALFQEIPALPTSDDVSDDDKLRTLLSRLDTGSFYENDRAAEALEMVVKEFMPDADPSVIQQEVDKHISFEKEDASSTDA